MKKWSILILLLVVTIATAACKQIESAIPIQEDMENGGFSLYFDGIAYRTQPPIIWSGSPLNQAEWTSIGVAYKRQKIGGRLYLLYRSHSNCFISAIPKEIVSGMVPVALRFYRADMDYSLSEEKVSCVLLGRYVWDNPDGNLGLEPYMELDREGNCIRDVVEAYQSGRGKELVYELNELSFCFILQHQFLEDCALIINLIQEESGTWLMQTEKGVFCPVPKSIARILTQSNLEVATDRE